MKLDSTINVPSIAQLKAGKIEPLTMEVLSLPATERTTIKRYDTVELTSRQDRQVSEEAGTYTRQFRRTTSGQISALLDDPTITVEVDPALLADRHKGALYIEAARSWNAKVEELLGITEARGFGYNETIKLFKTGYADWKANLLHINPEAYSLWIERMGEQENRPARCKSG